MKQMDYLIKGIKDVESGYKMLSKAIVFQACEDLLNTMKLEYRYISKGDFTEYPFYKVQSDALKFLTSDALSMYTDADGKTLIKSIISQFDEWKDSLNNKQNEKELKL